MAQITGGPGGGGGGGVKFKNFKLFQSSATRRKEASKSGKVIMCEIAALIEVSISL